MKIRAYITAYDRPEMLKKKVHTKITLTMKLLVLAMVEKQHEKHIAEKW